MTTLAPSDITLILSSLKENDRSAAAELLPLVYDELRSLANGYLRKERSDHTLQATALVHEAYLKLVNGEPAKWENRAHFFRVGAAVMRHILVNHARARGRLKRGGDRKRVPLDDALAVFEDSSIDLIGLDEALTRLALFDERLARVVELRFFAGLSNEETGEVLGISSRSVQADWQMAKLWLLREVSPQ